MTMTAQAFITAARQLKGARWRHRGRQPWALDCVGLIVLAGKAAGACWKDQIGYGREPWEDRLRKACRENFGEPLAPDVPRLPGDVALFRWKKSEPSHIAIIANHPDGGLSMIHAHNLHGVVECALSGEFARSVVEVYRPWREG